jgi:hypothetical protein
MVNPEEQLQIIPKPARIRKKTLLCRIILCMALTYFLILALLFLAGTIYSEKVIQIITPYYPAGKDIESDFHLFSLTGSILYFISSFGIILFMLKKKAGFYVFFLSAILILSLDFAFMTFDWLRYLIISGLIFILGIAHFSKRCYF